MSCVKTAEPIEITFGMWTLVGTRKHVLDGVHIGDTWRIRLNRPRAEAVLSNSFDHLFQMNPDI